jgi:phage FluMu protein gp41
MAIQELTGNDLLEALEVVAEEVGEDPNQDALHVFNDIIEGVEALYAVA